MVSRAERSLEVSCVIRIPTSGDYIKMANLAEQLGYPCSQVNIEARVQRMLDTALYGLYVADSQLHGILGWIGVHVFRSIESDACAEISGLVVDENWRSKGVGKTLLAAAEEWAREHGVRSMTVRSNVTRENAHEFYLRNGFEHIKTQKTLCKLLEGLD